MVAPNTRGVAYNLVVSSKLSNVPVATSGPNGWQATIKALKGTVISASGAGSAFDQILTAMFTEAGLSKNDYTNLSIAHGGPEIAAMKTGQADVDMVDFGNTGSVLQQAGGRVVMTLTLQGPSAVTNMAWSGFFATADYVAKHPEIVSEFQGVVDDTRKFMQDPKNKDAIHAVAIGAAQIPADTPGLDDAIAKTAGLMQTTFKTSDVQQTLDFLQQYGGIKPSPIVKPSDIIAAKLLT